MHRLVKDYELTPKKLMKEDDGAQLEDCVSVSRKKARSGRITWKGLRIKKMIGIIMWKEMQ